MPSVTIKGIPEKVLARIRTRAKRNKRSLNREIIHILEESGNKSTLNYEEIMKQVGEAHTYFSGNLPAKDVDKAKKAGRK
jgi:plasmid stability protein